MKKDKNWLRKAILKNVREEYFGESIETDKVFELVDQLDQLDEPELPAIPQFVADWIEKNKNKYNIKTALGNIDAQEDDICDWVLYNLDTFSIAFITGNYTVELEPYWVVSFQAGDFYSTLNEIAYFKEFIRDDSIRIKPNGRTFKNDPEVYGFKDKAKAEAVALLINGAVEEAME